MNATLSMHYSTFSSIFSSSVSMTRFTVHNYMRSFTYSTYTYSIYVFNHQILSSTKCSIQVYLKCICITIPSSPQCYVNCEMYLFLLHIFTMFKKMRKLQKAIHNQVCPSHTPLSISFRCLLSDGWLMCSNILFYHLHY